MKKKKAASKNDKPDRPSGQVYGYVLILRAIAGAACGDLRDMPAALRVLCSLVDFMDQDGKCRVSQFTLASRLGISRPAVNRQLTFLDNMGVLSKAGEAGRLQTYTLETWAVEDGRYGQNVIDRDRQTRRQGRQEARRKPKPPPAGKTAPKPQEAPQERAAPSAAPKRPTANPAEPVRPAEATRKPHDPTAHRNAAWYEAGTIPRAVAEAKDVPRSARIVEDLEGAFG